MNENGALTVYQTRRNRGSFCFGNHVAKHLPLILSNIVGNFFEVSMGAKGRSTIYWEPGSGSRPGGGLKVFLAVKKERQNLF